MRKIVAFCVALAATLLFAQLPARAQGNDKETVWAVQLPKGLDPHVVYDVLMQYVLLNNYDGLYRYIGNPPELAPWLAESHTVSEDGLTWTFKLHEGVKFHDGSDLNASDVVYSFTRLLSLGLGPSGAFKPVLQADNVTMIDDHTVQFVLDRPYAPFLAAIPLVAIVNEDLVKSHEKDGDWGSEWLASNTAGSGAYAIEAETYRPRETLTLKRNPDHFRGWDDNPKPIEVARVQDITETSTRVLSLLRGDVDATDSYLPADQVERVEKSEGVHVSRDESMRIFIIRMNNSRPPFDNINFRKCLSHAFNYTGFISGILKDFAERNPGPVPKSLWGSPADLAGYDYDLDKARSFCDQARADGAPIDREIEIHIQSAQDQTVQAAQLLQSDLRQLGVNLKLVSSVWPTLTSQASSPETTPDMWIHWVSTYFVDPENWIGQMYDSQFHGTWKASAWYKNDKVDELLRKARAATDKDVRQQAYEEASRIIVADAADIWVYNTVELRGLNDRVKGFKFSPVGSGSELRYIWLE